MRVASLGLSEAGRMPPGAGGDAEPRVASHHILSVGGDHYEPGFVDVDLRDGLREAGGPGYCPAGPFYGRKWDKRTNSQLRAQAAQSESDWGGLVVPLARARSVTFHVASL